MAASEFFKWALKNSDPLKATREEMERMQFRGWQRLSLHGTDADTLRQDIY